MDESALAESYLRRIIDRYADKINFAEQKSVIELKQMADPARVAVLKDRFSETDTAAYASACFDWVKSLQNIHLALPVSFWLTVEDVLTLEAGDALDKALLLVALVSTRVSGAFVRVVLLENGLQHPLVYAPLDGQVWLMDPVHGGLIKKAALERALEEYGQTHVIRKGLYEFNHAEYREL